MLARLDSLPDQTLALGGAKVVLDASGALVWPDERLLVVADLHLEKASSYARRGQMLPPYDSQETLARLAAAVARWSPAIIIALGDSLHDRFATERLGAQTLAMIRALQAGRQFIWIAGNHDPERTILPGDFAREVNLSPLVFRHEPSPDYRAGEVCGHLHPVARIVQRGFAIRRRCFATDGARMVLPAIGALAGGLDVREPAFRALFPLGEMEAHMLGDGRTYRIPLG